MRLYVEKEDYKLYNGNMLEMLDVIDENSITSIVCDPPYEISMLNQKWDNSGIAFSVEAWEKCLKVLKPGGYLVAFCGSRTFHRMVCSIEDAGFEIRDVIMWLYGSGMPKSSNVGKMLEKKLGHKVDSELYKYGNALKPAYEPILIARKPFKGSMLENMYNNNVGALNIDDCRIYSSDLDLNDDNEIGRFPSNIILSFNEDNYFEVCGGFPITSPNKSINMTWEEHFKNSAARYFYCAKANRKDRDDGLDDFEERILSDRNPELDSADNAFNRSGNAHKNFHPTVKNTEVMRYLIRLVTPKGGIVLDCFNGSGSTGKAVMCENIERNSGYKYIGIELSEDYLPISEARMDYIINKGRNNFKIINDREEEKDIELW